MKTVNWLPKPDAVTLTDAQELACIAYALRAVEHSQADAFWRAAMEALKAAYSTNS